MRRTFSKAVQDHGHWNARSGGTELPPQTSSLLSRYSCHAIMGSILLVASHRAKFPLKWNKARNFGVYHNSSSSTLDGTIAKSTLAYCIYCPHESVSPGDAFRWNRPELDGIASRAQANHLNRTISGPTNRRLLVMSGHTILVDQTCRVESRFG